MLGYFIVGTLASFGALSALWALFGWLLPREKGCAVVFWRVPEPEILTRFKWFRSMGLLSCPVIILSDTAGKPWEVTENGNEEELLIRLKQEYARDYGTGTGDFTGRGQRRGLSEL